MENELSNRLSLKSEIVFSRVQPDVNVFELPIFLKYSINNKFSVKTGFQANYMFAKEDMFPYIKIDENFGVDVGVGAEYNLSKKWFVDTKYLYRTTQQLTSPKAKMNVFRLGIGFRF